MISSKPNKTKARLQLCLFFVFHIKNVEIFYERRKKTYEKTGINTGYWHARGH